MADAILVEALQARGVEIAKALQVLSKQREALRREAVLVHRLLAAARGQPVGGTTEALREVIEGFNGEPFRRNDVVLAVQRRVAHVTRAHVNTALRRLAKRGEIRRLAGRFGYWQEGRDEDVSPNR